MERAGRLIAVFCILGILLGALFKPGKIALAQEEPTRKTTIIVPYTEYNWWLTDWVSNEILCQVLVDHEGMPTVEEVATSCGQDLADLWLATPPCQVSSADDKTAVSCTGLYIYMVSSQPKEREVIVELPTPVVWVDLEGCTPTPPDNRCLVMPALVLTGEEPLPNEKILDVQGTFDGQPFLCPDAVCKLPLHVTPVEGSIVEFWADSSYGDASPHFTAQVRVIDTGVSPQPSGSGWYVDVISTQWRGAPISTCASIWEAFHPSARPLCG